MVSRERREFAGNNYYGFQGRRYLGRRSLPSCISSRGNSVMRYKTNEQYLEILTCLFYTAGYANSTLTVSALVEDL